MRELLTFLVLLGSVCPALAQQSASFKMEHATFRSGGLPLDGTTAGSPSFHMSVAVLGQGLAGELAGNPAYSMSGGFVTAYLPPGEVGGVRFVDKITMVWDAEPAAGEYLLYRSTIAQPFDPDYGSCLAPPSPVTGTSAIVADDPSDGDDWAILLTVRNRLAEEGTKGFDGDGDERPNPNPCP